MGRSPTAFNLRIVESILETKGITSFGKLAELQPVNDGDLRKIVMALPSPLQYGLQAAIITRVDRKCDVHVGCAERIFPIGRGIVTDIVENGSPRRHALAEFFREAVQRSLRYPQRLEALMRERDAHPARQTRIPPFVCRSYVGKKATQHFTTLFCVVDAQDHVFASVRPRTWAQHGRLYVTHVKSGSDCHCHFGFNLRIHCVGCSPFH